MLDFYNFEILTANTIQRVNMRHHTKFCADWSKFKPLPIYGQLFLFFKMAAVRHLGFLKVRNFNCQHSCEGQFASPRQIPCLSARHLRRYGNFSIFD